MQVVANTALFLRADPSTDNPPLTLIPQGALVDAVTSHGWRQVVYNGQTGYVATEYISDALPLPLSEDTYTLSDLMPFFTEYGNRYGVDPQRLAAVAYQESSFKN